MKKHILPALLLGAICLTAPTQQTLAQISNDRGTFTLPGQGDILIETQGNFNFAGGFNFSLNDPSLNALTDGLDNLGQPDANGGLLKARIYGRNNMAQRFFLNIANSTNRFTDSSDNTTSASLTGIALGWGIEKNFSAAERLNTYIGGDVILGFGRAATKTEDPDFKVHQSAIGFGVRVVTGADYYVLPKVYLGIELGWGIGFNHYGEVHFEDNDNGVTSSSFGVAPFISSNFRLGYILCGKRMHGNGQPSYRSHDNMSDDE